VNEEITGWEVMGVTDLRFLETTAHWDAVIHDWVDGCHGGCQISVFAIIAPHSFRVCVILRSPLSFVVISSLSFSPLLFYPPHFIFISFLPLSYLSAVTCLTPTSHIMPSVSLDLLSVSALTMSAVLGLNIF
jgi:hypothetical protein